jgi:hypothetical protein
MFRHLKTHWRSWFVTIGFFAFACAIVIFSDAFQECINQSYYESSDYEPEKGIPLILGTLGWVKTCSGSFFKENGEAITAAFTVILGISTAGLWIATLNLYKAGENQILASRQIAAIQADQTRAAIREAVRSADAALLNAEALIDAERAQLYAVIKKSNLREAFHAAIHYENSPSMDGEYTSKRPEIELSFKNLGRTPAILHEMSFQLIQGMPNQREFEYVMAVVVDPVIDGGQETATTIPCKIENPLTIGDSRAAWDGDRPLYFYGFVAYATSFNRVYKYYWQYQNDGADWILTKYEDRERGKKS